MKTEQTWLPEADGIFKHVFFKEKCSILIQIPLRFVSHGLIEDKSSLV